MSLTLTVFQSHQAHGRGRDRAGKRWPTGGGLPTAAREGGEGGEGREALGLFLGSGQC